MTKNNNQSLFSDINKSGDQDIEARLFHELQLVEKDIERIVSIIAEYYIRGGNFDAASRYIHKLMDFTDNPELKAKSLLMLGQTSERSGNFEKAIDYYKSAYALEPADQSIWYLINNNLGYCLNQFGCYEEAESYCRDAVKIQPERHNAYKNLGISLAGQRRYEEGAVNLLESAKFNPNDPRAIIHLKELIREHPELINENPDFSQQVDMYFKEFSPGKKMSPKK